MFEKDKTWVPMFFLGILTGVFLTLLFMTFIF